MRQRYLRMSYWYLSWFRGVGDRCHSSLNRDGSPIDAPSNDGPYVVILISAARLVIRAVQGGASGAMPRDESPWIPPCGMTTLSLSAELFAKLPEKAGPPDIYHGSLAKCDKLSILGAHETLVSNRPSSRDHGPSDATSVAQITVVPRRLRARLLRVHDRTDTVSQN